MSNAVVEPGVGAVDRRRDSARIVPGDTGRGTLEVSRVTRAARAVAESYGHLIEGLIVIDAIRRVTPQKGPVGSASRALLERLQSREIPREESDVAPWVLVS